MSVFKSYLGDCLDVLAGLPAESVDSVVTDPPYHLTSIVKRFGKPGSAPCQHGTDGAFARASRGFMGKEWDGGDIAFRPETWAAVMRVMKPGAHLLAFGGTRGYHRMACAIEDAGFEIRDGFKYYESPANKYGAFLESLSREQYAMLLEFLSEHSGLNDLDWLYGSGFPKSHNLDGDRQGWGTAAKPAREPIVLARKPFRGTVAENVQSWGTGAINIDGCRVGSTGGTTRSGQAPYAESGWRTGHEIVGLNAGRWPANVIHDGSPEVLAGFPLQNGVVGARREGGDKSNFSGGGHSQSEKQRIVGGIKDTGSAARFFYCAKAASDERYSHFTCNCETVKLPLWIENNGKKKCQKQDQNQSVKIECTSQQKDIYAGDLGAECDSNMTTYGNYITDQFPKDAKSTTLTATSKITESKTCNCLPQPNTSDSILDAGKLATNGSSHAHYAGKNILSTQNISICRARDGHFMGVVADATLKKLLRTSVCANCGQKLKETSHPCVKPTDLMRYLCRLVTPPGGVVLDPFMGSGSTGKAAMLEGFRFVGIEREAEYLEIAEARIRAALYGDLM